MGLTEMGSGSMPPVVAVGDRGLSVPTQITTDGGDLQHITTWVLFIGYVVTVSNRVDLTECLD